MTPKIKYFIPLFLSFLILSCNMLNGPTPVSDWHKYKHGLKGIVVDIIDNNGKDYVIGENNIPTSVNFPYYNDFSIKSRIKDSINVNSMTVIFYTDKGLLDHYSAFIFTNDSIKIKSLERNVGDGGNDYKLEKNWYLVND